jgi:hypothetical protein
MAISLPVRTTPLKVSASSSLPVEVPSTPKRTQLQESVQNQRCSTPAMSRDTITRTTCQPGSSWVDHFCVIYFCLYNITYEVFRKSTSTLRQTYPAMRQYSYRPRHITVAAPSATASVKPSELPGCTARRPYLTPVREWRSLRSVILHRVSMLGSMESLRRRDQGNASSDLSFGMYIRP